MRKELIIAIEASVLAGKEIMEVYNSNEGIQVDYKSDDSPLTVADKKSNDVINRFLLKTPIPIISEENKQVDYEVRKQWDECWILDPLDGTKEFIKRNGEFTVNIALVKNGYPTLGVIYVPYTKELYFADVDKRTSYKAVIEDDWSVEEIIENANLIEPQGKSSSNVRIVGSRSHMNDDTKEFIEKVKTSGEIEIVSKGSSLKFCLIAEGEADIYPRFAPTMEWDTAAGQAICEAAGADVINDDTKEKLLYNKENLLNPWFICK